MTKQPPPRKTLKLPPKKSPAPPPVSPAVKRLINLGQPRGKK